MTQTPRHVHFTTCVGCASSTLVFVTTTITLQGVMYPPTWRSISPRHVGEIWGRNHWSQWSERTHALGKTGNFLIRVRLNFPHGWGFRSHCNTELRFTWMLRGNAATFRHVRDGPSFASFCSSLIPLSTNGAPQTNLRGVQTLPTFSR